jgi:hypothetical protein
VLLMLMFLLFLCCTQLQPCPPWLLFACVPSLLLTARARTTHPRHCSPAPHIPTPSCRLPAPV